jgi:hypothetical protein
LTTRQYARLVSERIGSVGPAPDDLQGPHRLGETRRTVDPGHSSDGPSWIDLVENRVKATESRFADCLDRLLQQNLPTPEVASSGADTRLSFATPAYQPAATPRRPFQYRPFELSRSFS